MTNHEMMIKTRILVISDTHNYDLDNNSSDDRDTSVDQYDRIRYPFRRELVPKADVVLHCGDLTNFGGLDEHETALRMLGSLDAELKLVIAGNHDLTLDRQCCDEHGVGESLYQEAISLWTGPLATSKNIRYLEEGLHNFTLRNGAQFTVYATPYSAKIGSGWAFQYEDDEDRFISVPSFPRVDIMMTHGPPKYVLDECAGGSVGCEHLLRAVRRARPRLHCFGHIHDAFGCQEAVWGDANTQGVETLPATFVGRNQMKKKGYAYKDATGLAFGAATVMVNASIMDKHNEPENAPWLIDVELQGQTNTSRDS